MTEAELYPWLIGGLFVWAGFTFVSLSTYVTAPYGRHTRAGWFDAIKLPDRMRNRWLGHAPKSSADTYGPIDFSEQEIDTFESETLEIERRVIDLLLGAKRRADAGELKRVILPRLSQQKRLSKSPTGKRSARSPLRKGATRG